MSDLLLSFQTTTTGKGQNSDTFTTKSKICMETNALTAACLQNSGKPSIRTGSDGSREPPSTSKLEHKLSSTNLRGQLHCNTSFTSNGGATSKDGVNKPTLSGDVQHVTGVQMTKLDVDDWENDRGNPQNWTSTRKWITVLIVSLHCFITPLTSSMMAPGLPQVGEKYHITSPTLLALTLSIFLLSFAIGPLIMSPLSEMYGRKWILLLSNIITMGLNFACAYAPNTASLLVIRLIAGFSGSGPVAVGGGTISDLFAPTERARAMAIFTCGPLLGPALGPAAGGFIAETIGVKYVFIVLGCVSGVAALVGLPLMRETYAPVLRLRQARRSVNPEAAVAKVLQSITAPEGSKAHVVWVNMTRPVALLLGNFVCFMLSLYLAFNYGIYYLMFTTFAKLFKDTYGFSPGLTGLCYLGLGLGFFIGAFVGVKFSDKMYQILAEKNNGVGTPEMRMKALFPAGVCLPVGLLWYGWSAHYAIHWIMTIIGTVFFGYGLMTAHLGIQLYLVDAFKYAASAVGAAGFFRSILGFAFPLFGQQMFDALGLGPANSLLAGIATVIGIPFPIWIYYRGAALRERSNVLR